MDRRSFIKKAGIATGAAAATTTLAAPAIAQERIEVVERTLADLKFAETPRILVLNKIDLLSELEIRMLMQSLDAIAVSAHERIGFEELLLTLQDGLATSFRGLDPGSFTADAVS